VAALIGLVSQKGDVNKGTLARLIAREYSEAGWHVKIVDLHISQAINTNLEAMARACRY
jgi:chromosome partitioning protein